jgi:hypothetical protein
VARSATCLEDWMKRTLPILLVALGLATHAQAGTRSISRSFPTHGADQLRIEFPAGDLRIEAGDVDEIQVVMTARCRHGGRACARRAEELRLVSDTRGRTRTFKLEGWPKFWNHGLSVRLEFTVPRSMAARIEMGAGDLRVDDLDGSVEVSMGAGDVNLRLDHEAIGSVRANVGVGDATLVRMGRRIHGSGFIARRVHWAGGDGPAAVRVHLGVGDVSISLD